MELEYFTRDGKGNDFTKIVKIKEFPIILKEFDCPVCGKHFDRGSIIKKCVSSSFTDWVYFDEDMICEKCSRLFTLYPYSYIVDDTGIRLLNIRQLKEQLITPQKPPFLFVITKSQKKHLFYKSVINESTGRFAVNLEEETIYTSCERMKEMFLFVESLMTLKQSKTQMLEGTLNFEVYKKTGYNTLEKLRYELQTSREIQIPLHCGQKLDITEEEALCNLDLTLKK